MSAELVIDGVTYRWRIEEDPDAGSLSFSHRGIQIDTVAVRGDDGSSVQFIVPTQHMGFRGWWRGPYRVTSEVIERAVRIARRSSQELARALVEAEREEAYFGPPKTLADELEVAGAALRVLARGDAEASRLELVGALLAIGCQDWARDDQTAEWVIASSLQLVAARKRLHKLLLEDGDNEHVYRNRSALAFLIEMCERNQVELSLDTVAADARLRTRPREPRLPWGIPESHWWWRQGGLRDFNPNDEQDD